MKRRNTAGETLVETLAALLVVVLAFLMLSGAIVSAARVNRTGNEKEMHFLAGHPDEVTGGTITMTYGSGAESRVRYETIIANPGTRMEGTYYRYEKE